MTKQESLRSYVRAFRCSGLAALAASGLLSGCAVGPDYVTPEPPLPESFVGVAVQATSKDGVSKDVISKDAIVEAWWKNFSEPLLEELIAESVAGNNSLEAALARVNQARAIRNETYLDFFPTVTAGGTYNNTRIFAGRFGGAGPQTFDAEFYNSGFDAVWEMDLWGRVRRGYEASTADNEASIADLDDALRVLVAEVARTFFDLRGLQRQIDVARENAKTQEQVVKIADALFTGGQTTEFDVVRARSQLSATLSAIPGLEANAHVAMYRLAVLAGRPPGEFMQRLSVSTAFPSYSGPLAVQDPLSLIRRRPDVRASERRLHAATARIGVAKGDYFPRVSLTGNYAFEGVASFERYARNPVETWGWGPSFSWAAFNMGRVLARVDASEAATQEALAQFEQTVLTALEDIEGALVRYGAAKRAKTHLEDAVSNNKRALDIARSQYENGLVDLLPVLDVQRSLLVTQDQLVRSETEVLTALVAVFKALGGGWGYFAPAPEGQGVMTPANPDVVPPQAQVAQIFQTRVQ